MSFIVDDAWNGFFFVCRSNFFCNVIYLWNAFYNRNFMISILLFINFIFLFKFLFNFTCFNIHSCTTKWSSFRWILIIWTNRRISCFRKVFVTLFFEVCFFNPFFPQINIYKHYYYSLLLSLNLFLFYLECKYLYYAF